MEPAEREFMTARAAFLLPERSSGSGWILLVTMALFALSMWGSEDTWKDIALLVAVVLFHELGHWLGMRLFGFQDVKMFFIPFFGAAVSGRNVGAVAWKEALVLLMGPMPGLVLGCVLLMRTAFEPSHTLSSAGLLLVALNAFNLLPLTPLDGGRLFQLLVFSRHRLLEIAFTAFAGLALLGMAILSGAWVMGVLAGMMLLAVPRQWKVLSTAEALRTTHPAVVQEPAALDEPTLRTLYAAAAPLVPPQATGDTALAHRVRTMREVHHRARMRPPSALGSLGLLFLWGGGVVVAAVALVLLAGNYAPRSPKWKPFTDARGGFTALMPIDEPSLGVVSYGTRLGRQEGGGTRHARLWVDHDYSVTYWKLEQPLATDEERAQGLEELRQKLMNQAELRGSAPVVDTQRTLAGIAGHHLAFSEPSNLGKAEAREEFWFGLHEGRGFILRAHYDSRLAGPEEAERFFTSFRPLP